MRRTILAMATMLAADHWQRGGPGVARRDRSIASIPRHGQFVNAGHRPGNLGWPHSRHTRHDNDDRGRGPTKGGATHPSVEVRQTSRPRHAELQYGEGSRNESGTIVGALYRGGDPSTRQTSNRGQGLVWRGR